jgi:hypothetical protein
MPAAARTHNLVPQRPSFSPRRSDDPVTAPEPAARSWDPAGPAPALANGPSTATSVTTDRPPVTSRGPDVLASVGRIVGPWPAVLLMAGGLFLVALAVAAANDGATGGAPAAWQPAFLLGILLIVVPAGVGLALPRARPSTPVVLSLTLAALLQAVQVIGQPALFVRDDDVARILTVREIALTGQPFAAGPLAPDLAAVPGLALATTGVQALTGLSVHASALALVVLARVVLAGSVLLIVTQLTRSSRIGALAVVLYAVNPQLLLAGDLWSPGRLATALAVFAAYLLVSRRRGSRISAGGAALALIAVAWTDQRTAVAMVVALLVWLVAEALLHPAQTSSVPALAAALAVAALAVVVVAVHATTVTGGTARQDRAPASTPAPSWLDVAAAAPGWVAALLTTATVLTVLGVVVGLVRSRLFVGRRVSLAVVLAVAALLSLLVVAAGVLPVGHAVATWSLGLVVVGTAFVSAWWFWQRRPRRWRAALLGVVVALIGVGGAVGAPTDTLPSGQTAVVDGLRGYDPETLAAVTWMSANLPPDSRVYTDADGGLLLAVAARQVPVTQLDDQSANLIDVLSTNDIQYVAADRRRGTAPSPQTLGVVADSPVVSTVYDNGSVVVYALEPLGATR